MASELIGQRQWPDCALREGGRGGADEQLTGLEVAFATN